MDSASKRKATNTPADSEPRSAKRQKVVSGADGDTFETPETTTEVGFKFLDNLKNAKDKTGRSIITEFLTLPDRKKFPTYYQAIKLPISIETIEEKLRRKAYPNLSAVEGDLKRLVTNAKTFNDKRSTLYEDAERVRKTASNFMTRHNPAYKTPGYVAVPTPLSEDDTDGGASLTPAEPTNGAGPKTVTLKITAPAAKADEQDAAEGEQDAAEGEQDAVEDENVDAKADAEDEIPDFSGKTFQEAQEQIVEELIHYEDSGLEIFTPFVNLPSRALTDYYSLIKHPLSLNGAKKKVKGVKGRNVATGATVLQSWDSFEEELSYIWRNAQEYNEDGSEIYNLAEELKTVFKERLALAKSKVEQPPQPTLKLKMSSDGPKKLKLNFGGSNKASPGAPSPASTPGVDRNTPGVLVHGDALARQQQMVAAGMNGGKAPSIPQAPPPGPRNPFGADSRSGSASTPIPALKSTKSAASPPVHTNGIKKELHTARSPALSAVRPSSAASGRGTTMPPPNGISPRPQSGSPQSRPQLQTSLNPTNNNYSYQPPLHYPTNGFIETKTRPAGQTAADSILPSVTLITHPSLILSKPFSLIIPARSRNTQQSVTVTLPSTHHFFQITPHIPVGLTHRPYRLFVTVNGQRMSECVKPGAERDKSRPLFEIRLGIGQVSRVEVEVLAGKGTFGKGGKEDVDWERCTLFVHVMRL